MKVVRRQFIEKKIEKEQNVCLAFIDGNKKVYDTISRKELHILKTDTNVNINVYVSIYMFRRVYVFKYVVHKYTHIEIDSLLDIKIT